MEAYSNACTAYAQQFFIHHNRALVQSGTFGPVSAPNAVAQYVHGESVDPLPVRIDPEEEKRVSILRKRIATSEAHREILETEYMSLRSHYVFESQRLRKARLNVDGQVKLLQGLTRRRAKVLALRRVRCGMARDIFACLERRNAGFTPQKEGDISEIWTDVEARLAGAEKDCRSISIPEELRPQKKKKRKPEEEENIIPWDCRLPPRTPFGVPVMLSQMSTVPDKAVAWGTGGMFGSKKTSMCWLEQNLPKTCDKRSPEHMKLKQLRAEAASLQQELRSERACNKQLQRNIIAKRIRQDELCSMMTLLRSETEAVLTRHNILLSTPTAQVAAHALHAKITEMRRVTEHDEDDNDGDDEGSDISVEQGIPPEVVVPVGGHRDDVTVEQ